MDTLASPSTGADTAHDVRYRAYRARDARFDGRFVVGVLSTGIYCRPICPARTPRPAHCRFFEHPAQAEQAGFRPCLRCRPERAPGGGRALSRDDLNGRLVEAAARAIEQGALDDAGLNALAARIGLSPRHLRRLFHRAYGVSPLDYALTQRLLAAKRLLTDTPLPVAEVALAAGFGSLRRFNAVFRERYGMPPGRLRRETAGGTTVAPSRTLTLELGYRPPLAWEALIAFLGRRAVPGVERIFTTRRGSGHARVVRHRDGTLGWLAVTPLAVRNVLHLEIPADQAARSIDYLRLTRRLFDLDARIDRIDTQLGALAAATPGLRVPGGAEGFEVAVRAIVGQVISLGHARTLLTRLTQTFGEPFDADGAPTGLDHAFPAAGRIAASDPAELASLGLIRAKAGAIHALARAIDDGRLMLSPDAPLDETLVTLKSIPGVGAWTAQIVAMRALDWPDAWPGNDLVLRRRLASHWPTLGPDAEPWSPWRAYAAMHLWHHASLDEAARSSAEDRP
ncbi:MULTISPECIES: Ada metal-binding domain-containing protein [unclassified Modicisalibacter]|uniref:Ada metal-binding domain-containing protein n=1 Tax=unclassified Modicisalibacter TaxID=2679913 RepID=UPI001CCD6415|nr:MULTISPECIES: Ada metal-binding domain-containing protein [unclassified Modicisalibacter]MBZ9557674.1 DNA-3-methyladenine glycosylase 2 family protein [Modicisalibacter sp. R2A 31.J]MBZ9573662.1 DNA-3-methyladenine glycosylase 2 family protein [Modicisalibacter sp. MOD 31.J]